MKSNFIRVLSTHFINFETGELIVGGIQSYIKDLSEIAHQLGFMVVIYDFDLSVSTTTLKVNIYENLNISSVEWVSSHVLQ